MTEERTTPLRERMIEDMRIRGMGDKAQQAHIRTEALGGHVAACTKCGHNHIAYNSCRTGTVRSAKDLRRGIGWLRGPRI
jgi:hypothetical protein